MSKRAAGAPIQILLVDDNPGDVELTTLALQAGAIPSEVNSVQDGAAALAFLHQEEPYQDAPRPDLILLDLNMPGKDGRDTLSEIKQNPDLCDIPLVILTVSESERDLLDTYHLKPDCYVVKPLDAAALSNVVHSLDASATLNTPAPRLTMPEFPPPAAEATIRVLLAEDNPGDVELTRAYLQEAQQVAFTLEAVEDLAGLMQRLETENFDVLLLDLSILEGRDLRESIATFRRASNLAVVVLTGLDDERFGMEALSAGAEDYLVKGHLHPGLLVRSIRFAAERHSRKCLLERLNQVHRLEEIGRLAGGVAHDFNNILTVIMGFTELARDIAPEGDALSDYLNCIGAATGRASELTQQLLAFARKQIIQPQVLDLHTCVRNSERMLRRLITEDIELSTRLVENLWHVKVDPGQIEQVIVNLVVNARDAMPNGGQIEVEAENVLLGEQEARRYEVPAGEYVLLAVRDTGEGMSNDVKAHIFEPFFTTKEQGKGTGLGLATCFGIVQQNGGSILADSAPGMGTTIRIYFPRHQVKGEEDAAFQAEKGETPLMHTGGETILLVEDEPLLRQIAAQMLRNHGYVVLEASNGVEALQLAATLSAPLDLLVTDMVMPQMGGRETAERLLATHPNLKTLFVSGYTDDVLARKRILEEGASFLQKPFTPIMLARKVWETLTQASE